jgi:hypothetical protein
MAILQLNPSLPLVTNRGVGDAHLVIDYGSEANLLWVVFLRESGQCWCFQNKDVRLEKNITYGINVGEDGDKTAT